jgi:hypothetical protein
MILATFFGAFLQHLGNQYFMKENARLTQQVYELSNELDSTKKKLHDLSILHKKTENRTKELVANANRISADYTAMRTLYEAQEQENASASLQARIYYAKSFVMLVSFFFLATILVTEWRGSLGAWGAQAGIGRMSTETGVAKTNPTELMNSPVKGEEPPQDGPYPIDDVKAAVEQIAEALSAILSGGTVLLLAALILCVALEALPILEVQLVSEVSK